MKSTVTTGNRIKIRRNSLGLTQDALAKKAGMSAEWLCRVEGGHRQPEIGTLTRLARALGVSLDYLAGTTVKSSKPATQRKANASKNGRT